MNAALVKARMAPRPTFLSLDASDKLAEKAAEVENAREELGRAALIE